MRMKVVLLIFMVSVFSLINCSAQPSGQASKRGRILEVKKDGKRIILYEKSYALLIGISNYQHWTNLRFIPQEMRLLKSALERNGFIVDKHDNLTSDQLKRTMDKFISTYGLKEHNRLLIFFSGHGCTRREGTRGYIVPSDAPRPEDNENEFVNKAIEMEQILTWAKKIESKHALFVFDSCFSGTIFQTKGSTTPTPTPDYVTYLTGRPVRQFITAGDEKERVLGESVFLQCFLKGIEGDADSDKPKDFYITGTELGLYLQKEVPTYNTGHTPQFGKLRDPKFDRGDFIFILPPPPNDIPQEPPPEEIETTTPNEEINIPIDNCFESLGCEKTVSVGSILVVKGNFEYSNDKKYWLAFIDDDRIWPMVEISEQGFRKTAAVPTTNFYGGKLVLICVKDETHERFRKWSSPNPLIKQEELSIILETKINIERSEEIKISSKKYDSKDYSVFPTNKIFVNLRVSKPIYQLRIDWGDGESGSWRLNEISIDQTGGEWHVSPVSYKQEDDCHLYVVSHKYNSPGQKNVKIIIFEGGRIEHQESKKIEIN